MSQKEKIVAPPEPAWLVLLMLFVLMGPLALPMLWSSPHFQRPTKVVLTVLVSLIAIAAIVVLWLAVTLMVPWLIDQMPPTRWN